MQVFKTTQGGFAGVRKKLLLRTIPFLLFAGAGGTVLATINTKHDKEDINILPVFLPTVALALGFGLYRGVNRQKALYESFTLTITDNLVKREQQNTPTIWLYFNDITTITRQKDGSFIIKGKDSSETIMIPVGIDNTQELETTLQSIHAITTKDTISFFEKYKGLSGLVTGGLMICVYVVRNKWIVAITGTAFVVLMVWSLSKIQSNKNIDEKTKRNSWLSLLVLLSVIAIMFFKLTAG